MAGLLWLTGFAAAAIASEPLHERIDAMVMAAAEGQQCMPVADDAEFARRLYLDLAGRIPSRHELRGFLDNPQSNKRELLVDQLLTGPDYPRRMQELFTAMLLERRGEDPQWTKFLRDSFQANKPWDQLTREIVDPDPDCEATRGAAFFHTKRLEKVGEQETDYPGLTRDVGRLFLGMDLQCAQCHDHLYIDSYRQQDFQGLLIAFQNTFIRRDLKFPAVGVKPVTQRLEFMSVFDQVPLATGPRLPGGKEVEIPSFDKGDEYLQPPDRKANFPGIPRFNPLEVLANEMATPQNRAFVDNIANRLWFVLMGRGLVDPLDQHHVDNPPSHPEVLELLGQEFVEHEFNIRWLLRELALSKTYQRSSRLPPEGEPPAPASYLVGNEKHLSAEQICWSVLIATGPSRRHVPGAAEEVPRESNEPESPSDPDGEADQSIGRPGNADLDELRAAFVKAFANPPQDPEVQFNPSLKAALFLMNDSAVIDLLVANNGNLVDRLTRMTDPTQVSTELYECVLSRSPNEEETAAVADYLQSNAERREAAVSNLVWALLASTEFCVNH